MTARAAWAGDPVEAACARRLVAKMISELAWEGVLAPRDGALRLASGAIWRFSATRRVWDNLDIDPESLSRDGGAVCPFRLTLDARAEMGMSAATEATFLRELANTLMQDVCVARRWGGMTGPELIALPTQDLHAALEGHPKALANRGRLGWGVADHAAFAPENAAPIRLEWLAVARARMVQSGDAAGATRAALGPDEHARLLKAAGPLAESHALMPVHPWQLDHHVAQLCARDAAAGAMVHLGAFGPAFRATPSLRTLTPAQGGPFDVKLALGILNTSAWRGVPGKYIAHGGAISDWLDRVVAADPDLACVTVLREVCGQWRRDPLFAERPEAPYRHHETLGAIWRENAEARLGPDRRAVMAAALFHQGADGAPLAVHYAAAAGMPLRDWLRALFRVTAAPLWLFLCRYGVGFIAHGQNVTVALEGGRPVGMAIKDFQGDLDLVDSDFPEAAGLPAAVRAILPRKPPPVIVHDIQTAHFVTTLRFLSARLARCGALDERCFHAILREELSAVRAARPWMAARFALFDLFAPTLPRVCINRVRFAIGYEDSAERPLPARGVDLRNPLAERPDARAFDQGSRAAVSTGT